MYIFFILRMDVAFHDSAFKYSKIMFSILYSLVIISCFSQLTIYIFFSKGQLITINQDLINKQQKNYYLTHFCGNSTPFWVLIFSAILDLFLSSLLCGLFVQRLFKAFISVEHDNKNHVTKQLYKIAKYITLTIVGVTTTFCSLVIFGLTSWYILISIDLIINSWCVFLMYRKNRSSFNMLCGICHKCVGRTCFWCIQCLNIIDDDGTNNVVYNNTEDMDTNNGTGNKSKKSLIMERRESFMNVYGNTHLESSASVISLKKLEYKHQRLAMDDTDDDDITETVDGGFGGGYTYGGSSATSGSGSSQSPSQSTRSRESYENEGNVTMISNVESDDGHAVPIERIHSIPIERM